MTVLSRRRIYQTTMTKKEGAQISDGAEATYICLRVDVEDAREKQSIDSVRVGKMLVLRGLTLGLK